MYHFVSPKKSSSSVLICFISVIEIFSFTIFLRIKGIFSSLIFATIESLELSNDSIIADINEENIPLVLKKMVKEDISINEMKQMRTLEELFLGLTK